MRQNLIDKIQQLYDQAPDIAPVVLLDEYFSGNTDEECIACNQIGYGRPPLEQFCNILKSIGRKPEVRTILVGLHPDWEEVYDNPEIWPAAENIHIYTDASADTVKEWVNDLAVDYIHEGWTYGEHPAAPKPEDGFKIYTLCWD